MSGPRMLLSTLTTLGWRPRRLKQIVRFHQAVDLADAVAGMRDAQLAAGDARLGLHLDPLLRTPAVRVRSQSLLQASQLCLRDQVLDHDEPFVAVVGKLLVGQVDCRSGASVLCHCHHGGRVGAGLPRGKRLRRVRPPTWSTGSTWVRQQSRPPSVAGDSHSSTGAVNSGEPRQRSVGRRSPRRLPGPWCRPPMVHHREARSGTWWECSTDRGLPDAHETRP